MSDAIPWLPPPFDGPDATDDPWADVDLPEVSLSDEQQGFLASFAEQPAIPRLRDLGAALARFEQADFDGPPVDEDDLEPG